MTAELTIPTSLDSRAVIKYVVQPVSRIAMIIALPTSVVLLNNINAAEGTPLFNVLLATKFGLLLTAIAFGSYYPIKIFFAQLISTVSSARVHDRCLSGLGLICLSLAIQTLMNVLTLAVNLFIIPDGHHL